MGEWLEAIPLHDRFLFGGLGAATAFGLFWWLLECLDQRRARTAQAPPKASDRSDSTREK